MVGGCMDFFFLILRSLLVHFLKFYGMAMTTWQGDGVALIKNVRCFDHWRQPSLGLFRSFFGKFRLGISMALLHYFPSQFSLLQYHRHPAIPNASLSETPVPSSISPQFCSISFSRQTVLRYPSFQSLRCSPSSSTSVQDETLSSSKIFIKGILILFQMAYKSSYVETCRNEAQRFVSYWESILPRNL